MNAATDARAPGAFLLAGYRIAVGPVKTPTRVSIDDATTPWGRDVSPEAS